MVTDYLNSGCFNQLIETEQDYCDIILHYGQDDEELYVNEWHLCRLSHQWFARHWLWIENRDAKLQRLIFNAPQLKYHAEKTDRDVIDKARKEGFSTYIAGEFFHANCFANLTKTNVVAHDLDSTQLLFDMVRRFYDNLPHFLKPIERYNTKKELEFTHTPFKQPLNTKYSVLTAGSKEIGRSRDIDRLHLSEFAYYPYPEKIFAGALQAMREGSKVRIESTANGYNAFNDLWNDAVRDENGYKPHFFAWFDDARNSKPIPENEKFRLNTAEKEYKQLYGLTNEQVKWYRDKLKEPGMRNLIKQEHPFTAEESFLESGNCYFDKEKLSVWLKKAQAVEPIHERLNGMLKIYKRPQDGKHYVAAADTAEHESGTGNDSALIVREVETWEKVALLHMPGKFKAGVVRHNGKKLEFSKEKLFAKLVERVGKIYNVARIAIESNKGRTHLSYLKDWRYPNLYKHKDFDAAGKSRRRLGFNTNAKTRRPLLDGGNEAIDENLINMLYPEEIRQFMTFVVHENGEIKAQTGKKDDLVFAELICIHLLKNRKAEPKVRMLHG